MTDNEIIKALELCITCTITDFSACEKCPYNGKCGESDTHLWKDTLALINRQKTEIEGYKHYYNECLTDLKNAHKEIEKLEAMVDAAEEHFAPLPFKNNFDKYIEKVKYEAIKEFANRLKENATSYEVTTAYAEDEEIEAVEVKVIDNLIKEMTERINESCL